MINLLNSCSTPQVIVFKIYMKYLFSIIKLTLFASSANAANLTLDSLYLNQIEDSIFYNNYTDTLNIENITTMKRIRD